MDLHRHRHLYLKFAVPVLLVLLSRGFAYVCSLFLIGMSSFLVPSSSFLVPRGFLLAFPFIVPRSWLLDFSFLGGSGYLSALPYSLNLPGHPGRESKV